ncbi:PspC domain-containing protein [Algoriphagus halophytocola]|uniref:PspC domain-containing protein n=1 Tax=Algoriphagus halophytocola TaxID=2991499 RepID=A0ABY6MLK0_9BACT|nr:MULTISPECIES: PspC domain-containing protein [unclassified Algoriphagus]UZD23566.1 PspC domain-containing protein [Algoriphagus sp. TR-M5]WBL44860.1 PspC domain-containing protein [Algoriphagus sp. TR-M9]
MSTQKIQSYLSKPEKLLLGVCAVLSIKTNMPSLALRIGFIAFTIIFIPLAILSYLILFLAIVSKKSKAINLALTGTLLGVPLSYYFQTEMVQNWRGSGGIISYLVSLPSILEEYHNYVGSAWDIVSNIILAMLVCAAIGGTIGYYLEKNSKRKQV